MYLSLTPLIVPHWGVTSCSLRLQDRAVHFSDPGRSPWGLLFLNHQRLLVEINSVFVLILSLVKHSSGSLSRDLPWFFHQIIVQLSEIYKNWAEHIGLDWNRHLWHQGITLPHCLLSPNRDKENTTFFMFFFIYMPKKKILLGEHSFPEIFFPLQSYVCWKQQNVHRYSANTINLSVLHVSCPSLLNFMK